MIALGISLVTACAGNHGSERDTPKSCDQLHHINEYHFADPVTGTCGIFVNSTGLIEKPCPPILALPAFRGIRHCFEKTETKGGSAYGKN